MRKLSVFIVMLLVFSSALSAQVAVNSDGSAPDASAGLDVCFTNKGFLPPRMTTVQRDAISFPAEGLFIFNLTTGCIDYFLGGSWKSFCGVSEPIFQCGMRMTDTRDGKLYNTVQIGAQCWMAQNLNVGAMINATVDQTGNGIIEKYCYNNVDANCAIYGGLYQWDELMNYTTSSNANPSGRQGICPTGWHVPSDAEWCQLETYLDPTVNCTVTGMQGTDVGGKMKETGTSHWTNPNTGATNYSGFTGLPGGNRNNNQGGFSNIAGRGIFWSATESALGTAWNRSLNYENAQVYLNSYFTKAYGFSGRCAKD